MKEIYKVHRVVELTNCWMLDNKVVIPKYNKYGKAKYWITNLISDAREWANDDQALVKEKEVLHDKN